MKVKNLIICSLSVFIFSTSFCGIAVCYSPWVSNESSSLFMQSHALAPDCMSNASCHAAFQNFVLNTPLPGFATLKHYFYTQLFVLPDHQIEKVSFGYSNHVGITGIVAKLPTRYITQVFRL